MGPNADTVPAACPDCGGRVITACPKCGAGIASMMALTCAGCGEELRPPHLFGTEIRRKPERHRRLDSPRAKRDNERTPS
jgi:predicted amidophosphoribosyltransferase